MAGTTRGDEVAAFSGWRVFFIATALIVVTMAGSLGAAMALYPYRYGMLVGAIVLESGLAALHIFCGGNLGRGYNPLHPIVRAQLLRLLALHCFVVAVMIATGVLIVKLAPSLGSWWVAEQGPKHDSPLSTAVILLLVGIYISETLLARRWLQRAVTQQGVQTTDLAPCAGGRERVDLD